jgi:hypothetical protein
MEGPGPSPASGPGAGGKTQGRGGKTPKAVALRVALRYKEKGNQMYKARRFFEALACYTKAGGSEAEAEAA